MKLLNGAELAGFIKQRQVSQVRRLVQADAVQPKLAIVRTNPDPVVDSYMNLKQKYGQDVGITVAVHTIKQNEALSLIDTLNADPEVHGIIVQIPLPDITLTQDVLDRVAASKDVDGLASKTNFDPATPMAINWLLAGYNIELRNKKIVIVGHGRLVGKPLARIWDASGLDVEIADRSTKDLSACTKQADVLVCATGVPSLVTANMIKPNVVIVDAGVATDNNGLIGDVAPDVREMPDIIITPEKGGVGPLTVCALFENVIKAANNQ